LTETAETEIASETAGKAPESGDLPDGHEHREPGETAEGVTVSNVTSETSQKSDNAAGNAAGVVDTSNSPEAATAGLSAIKDEDDKSVTPKLIVGIGASAGGLQPLESFFRTVNPKSGNAYVVIQHLSPDFKSLMKELLGRHTTMEVYRAANGMQIEGDTVYLIPAGYNLRIKGQHLFLERKKTIEGRGPHFPIDIFFTSLAKSAESRAVAVVLSGTGTDGSRGIRAIDEAGGLVYVQDPATAQFDGMLNAARATGVTLQVMAPDQIATSVGDLAENGNTLYQAGDPELPQSDFQKVLSVLSEEADVDFSAYKATTLGRRIERRRVLTGCASLKEYRVKLQKSRDECRQLFGDLLISVTSFFRDEPAWKFLSDVALPKLIELIPADKPMRIWVSACSTGEEAYTMAMVVREALDKAGRSEQVLKLFATDVNQSVLDRAATGVYPESIAADIPSDLLKKYFTLDGDNYVVSRNLREMIIFAPHNILLDAPFTRTHLVSCRNALIYLRPQAQARAIAMMHFSLVQNGVLFLGASETVGAMENEFQTLKRKWCVFYKLRDVKLPIDRNMRARDIDIRSGSSSEYASIEQGHSVEGMLRHAVQALAIENNWVCLLCDGQFNLVHVLGENQKYLQIPQGGLTAEVTRLVSDDLSTPLRAAMNRAQRGRQTVNHMGIRCSNTDTLVDLQVIYRPTTRSFTEMYIAVIKNSAIPASEITASPSDILSAQQLNDLEYELRQTRENLQATIEELETTNEEQQATNEELTAANEELQSTNEELHSVNEELHTVNSEYQIKIAELTEVTNDIDNLLESTDIGVVFLDSNLNIRKYTPAATRDINLLPADIGRSFEDLAYHFDYPGLSDDMRRVLSLGEAIEKEVESRTSEHLLVRIHPYRAGNQLTVGIVLTFVNISDMKRIENALAQVETRYQHLFQSEMFGIVLGDLRTRTVVDANDAYLKLLQLSRSDLPISLPDVFPESEHAGLDPALRDLENVGTTSPSPMLLKKSDGSLAPVIIARKLISESEGAYVGFVLETGASTALTEYRTPDSGTDTAGCFVDMPPSEVQDSLQQVSEYSDALLAEYAGSLDGRGLEYLQSIARIASRLQENVTR